MQLNRLDYWLLDCVVGASRPLAWMIEPDIGEALNREPHGASDDEVATAFVRLFALGLIKAERPCGSSDDYESVDLGSRPEILKALAKRDQNCGWTKYYFTSRGGSVWEQAAQPDWNRFVDCPEIDLIVAASEEQADRYLAYQRDCWIRIDSEVQRRWLRPWQATYWKELPEGFELQFRSTSKPEHDFAKAFESEFFTAQPWWYTRPW